MIMNEPILGIDLGTTNSEVAVFENGQPRLIKDDSGEQILPSFVGLDDSGTLVVGEIARNQYTAHPERTVKSIKRIMGEDTKVAMGEKSFSPQEISAVILRRLKIIAEESLGRSLNKAVITVPAYFSDAQRQATREAGEIAGLEVVRMINEPTAAALAYEAGHSGQRNVVVYDLGGGTFDVSVVKIQAEVVEVVASHGDNHLGGDDFDDKITKHLIEHLKTTHGVDIEPSTPAHARLVRRAEAAKRVLSDNPFVSIEEEYLAEKAGKPLHLSLELSREKYEEMIDAFVEQTLEAVHTALNEANMTVADIQEIILVGGSTRTPLVQRRLEDIFGKVPRGEVDPDLIVAMGAAIQGALIGGEKASSVLVDVTPYTFGTSALGEVDGYPTPYMFVPIIRRNTPIPTRRSEVFFTVQDDQKDVQVRIFQGEDPDALQNIQIGEFMVEGLSKAPAGNPIVMQLDLDLNGVLHVSAREKKSGLEKKIVIENAMARFDEDEMKEARSRIANLFDEGSANEDETVIEGEAFQQDSNDQHRHEIVQATALVEKAKRMLDEAASEDRDDMVDMIESIHDAIKAEDWLSLKEVSNQLADILYFLET